MGSPAQPVSRGPALTTGAVNQFYVPITNPFAAEFAAAHGIVGAQGFTPTTYRLFGHGGNPVLFGRRRLRRGRQDRQQGLARVGRDHRRPRRPGAVRQGRSATTSP
jgi:hypothetical protein